MLSKPRNLSMGTLANSEDPDEMQLNSSGSRLKQHSGTEIHYNLEIFTCV